MKHTPLALLMVIMIWLSSCSSHNIQFREDILAINDSTNELRVSIEFELSQEATAYVEFWREGFQDTKFYSELSPRSKRHQITLVGLKGENKYQYRVIVEKEGSQTVSEIQRFITQKFPINILHLRWQEDLKDGLTGYILSQRRMVNGIIYILDKDGDVVWYNPIPKQPKLSHWTANNSILVLYGAAKHRNSSGDHIVEYDLYGNELFHLDLSDSSILMEAHHEVRFDEQGDLLTLIYEHKTLDLSGLGGEKDQNVMGDKIVRMDKLGKVLWEWSIFDYANPLTDTTILKTAEDWSHANSLSIDKDGNYLVSFRNFNQIWKVNCMTGDVIWKMGEGGTVDMEKQAYFSGQHAFHLNKNNQYMVFDNGRKNRETRVLTYNFVETNNSATLDLNISLPEELYCDKMGNAYLMENGNILICAPRTNSIVVINQEGMLLAHAKVGIPDPYRAEYIPSLYDLSHVK